MEYKNDLAARMRAFDHLLISQKFILRLLVVLVVVLAIVAGLGWERFNDLNKKYSLLQQKHDRLNRIYLQERGIED